MMMMFIPRYSWPLSALIHWEVKARGTSMKDVGGAGFAGSSPPLLGRERAAVDVDVGPERAALATMRPVLLLRETLVCIKKTAMRHKRGE